jgi:methyl-accepting chemotaxis protein
VAGTETRPALPPGLISGLLFFGVVITGSGYIIISKLNDFGALAVTAVPVLIMIGYAVLLGARLFRLRDDQAGDNLYYMGFLFTLTSLAVSLYQFSAAGSAEQIVQNFGIAIASTIAGITLRILFNQMRRDPVEVEATARMELAEASRRVKRELESVMLEFGYFRRATQQSVTDAFDEAQESIGKAHKDFSGELKKLSSKRSEQTLDGLNERTVQVLDVSRQLVREGEQLAKSTAKIVGAIDSLFVKLASRQTPEQIIQSELAPLIQSLTQALNSLHSSVETQAKNTEVNLEHAQSVVTAVNQLLQEIHAAEAPRLPAPRPRQVANDEP